ncbi:MAG: hypothetical protein K0M69_00135 [Youngiibacter sp.]|nr:hypothetical protein [Youngiibacter sp.]
MKLDRNFVIPMSLILITFAIGIMAKAAPALPIVLLVGIVIMPMLVVQQKTGNDWGKMFAVAMLMLLVYIVIMAILVYLAFQYEWIKNILIWPGDVISNL